MDDWVKLATRYYTDPKVRALDDDAAELMFVRGLARAGELQAGGFIPASDLGLLTRRRRWEALVKALVDARLWSPVDGGYRIAAWADWQGAADVLAARRQADRDRQRKRRAAVRQESSRDNGDVSRDVTLPEGEGEKELLKGGGSDYGGDPLGEPPRKCDKHTNTANPPKCGGCADARRQHEQWHAERKRDNASRRSADAKANAEAKADAIRCCELCDDGGYRDGRVCDHDPAVDTRAKRGAAAARAAIKPSRRRAA